MKIIFPHRILVIASIEDHPVEPNATYTIDRIDPNTYEQFRWINITPKINELNKTWSADLDPLDAEIIRPATLQSIKLTKEN